MNNHEISKAVFAYLTNLIFEIYNTNYNVFTFNLCSVNVQKCAQTPSVININFDCSHKYCE